MWCACFVGDFFANRLDAFFRSIQFLLTVAFSCGHKWKLAVYFVLKKNNNYPQENMKPALTSPLSPLKTRGGRIPFEDDTARQRNIVSVHLLHICKLIRPLEK